MRRRLLLLALLLWCLAGAATAAPVSTDVVLYPSSAQVRVVETLPVRDGAVAFVLPASAELDSLVISLDKGAVVSREATLVPVADGAGVTALRRELVQAREEAAALEGEMAAVATRIALWSKGTLAQETSVAELEKLDAAMTERMKDLYRQSAALKPELEKARGNVKRLEQALSEYGDVTLGTRVTARVDGVVGEARVRYVYTLLGCGWAPVYRFDAEPEKGLVRFTQQAQIRQSSGQDWKGVRLTLASGNSGRGVSPAPVSPWRLYPLQAVQARKAAPVALSAVGGAPNMAEMDMAAPVMPSAQEMATLTTWDMGVRDVPAGTAVLFDMAKDDWKARFVRLARPGDGDKAAWLMAEIRLSEAVDLPAGTAMYLVDGLPVGSKGFSMTGDQVDLFFGRDARVSVEMKQDVRRSGSKGFVGKRQTRIWKWTIEIENTHTTPVAVRVEDPEPQIGDKAIEVKVTANPAPVVEEHVTTWNLEVPASGKRVIDYTVEASAPEDMKFVDGR